MFIPIDLSLSVDNVTRLAAAATLSGMHVRLAVLAVGWVFLASGAQADSKDQVKNRKHRFQLTLGSGWTEVAQPEESRTPLVGWLHRRTRATLAINRVDHPNLQAWRKKNREAYYQEIEKGVMEQLADYERIAFRMQHIKKIPVFELSFRHRGARDGRRQSSRLVMMRFIFYRRYSLSMSLSIPERTFKRKKRIFKRVRDSFVPLY